MARDRFCVVKLCLHNADNPNLVQFKVAKILKLLPTNCQHFGVFHKNLTIHESIMSCRRLHSAKQYIKDKPDKFSYKRWVLCSSDRYPHNFGTYCDKDENRPNSLGTDVVDKNVEPCNKPKSARCIF